MFGILPSLALPLKPLFRPCTASTISGQVFPASIPNKTKFSVAPLPQAAGARALTLSWVLKFPCGLCLSPPSPPCLCEILGPCRLALKYLKLPVCLSVCRSNSSQKSKAWRKGNLLCLRSERRPDPFCVIDTLLERALNSRGIVHPGRLCNVRYIHEDLKEKPGRICRGGQGGTQSAATPGGCGVKRGSGGFWAGLWRSESVAGTSSHAVSKKDVPRSFFCPGFFEEVVAAALACSRRAPPAQKLDRVEEERR